jgi:hypothetical protein
VLADGRFTVKPFDNFSPDVREFWASFDGTSVLVLMSPEAGNSDTVVIKDSLGSRSISLDGRAADVSLSPLGDAVVYRDLSTARFVSRLLTEGRSTSIATGEFAFGAISRLGILAAGTAVDPGDANELCTVKTTLAPETPTSS